MNQSPDPEFVKHLKKRYKVFTILPTGEQRSQVQREEDALISLNISDTPTDPYTIRRIKSRP